MADCAHRLPGRQSDFCSQGFRGSRRRALHAGGGCGPRRASRNRRSGRRSLRRDDISRRGVARAIRAAVAARRAAARHLPRPAVAVRGQRRGADCPGWALIDGPVRAAARPTVKVPHVGWNTLEVPRSSPMLDGFRSATQVYFTHSMPRRSPATAVAATTHGERFAAAVSAVTSLGVQFHPEKSGDAGIAILAQLRASAHRRQREREPNRCCPSASSPASTSATARSSKASIQGLRRAGDPAELAERYNAEGIDELVILDVTATIEGGARWPTPSAPWRASCSSRSPSAAAFATEEDAAAAIDAGADKVSINSAALADPSLCHDARRALRQPGRRRRHRCQAATADVRGLRAKRQGGRRIAMPSSGRAKRNLAAPARSC